ncbi:MAG: hypothetical protein VX438_08480 [Planctomycetota bacterium]|nr:hypothetical protein [Planctomycetota bacterium]
MDFKSIKTWSLVSYLAVLLSCGEALHQLPCFGHHHSCAAGVELNEAGFSTGCSCGNHGEFTSPTGEAQLNDPKTGRFGECLVCGFFDEYQTVMFSLEIELTDLPCSDQVFFDFGWFQSVAINAVARGPPIFS